MIKEKSLCSFTLMMRCFNGQKNYPILEKETNLNLYVPQRNDSINDKKNNDSIITDVAIPFQRLIHYVKRADILIANLDGLTIDDGVSAEIMAFGVMQEFEQTYGINNKRLIIGILTDMRAQGTGENRLYRNLMIMGKIKEHGKVIYGYPNTDYFKEIVQIIKDFEESK